MANELKKFINLEKCTRDGSTLYRGAITNASPSVIQVSDRFHLIKNCIDAVKDDLKKTANKHIVLDGEKYDLSWLKIQLPLEQQSIIARLNKKQEQIEKIRYEYESNHMNKVSLIEKYNLDLRTINRYLEKDAVIPRRNNRTSLTKYSDVIYNYLIKYKDNVSEINYRAIYKSIVKLGYDKSYMNFYKQLRLRIIDNDLQTPLTISNKEYNKLLYGKTIESLNRSEEVNTKLKEFLQGDNPFSKALNIVTTFKEIVNGKETTTLEEFLKQFEEENQEWIKVKEFMKGIGRDIEAVKNQIKEKITNSTTEGFVSKIKTIKKRTYGRASFAHIKSLLLL